LLLHGADSETPAEGLYKVHGERQVHMPLRVPSVLRNETGDLAYQSLILGEFERISPRKALIRQVCVYEFLF